MAEEDVIIIEDSDEDVIIIDDDIDDEDVIIIEDDNQMEIDNEDEDDVELEPSETDSDYESDSSDELIDTKHRHLKLTEIMEFDHTKKCCIAYYYVMNDDDASKYCTVCFYRLSFLFLEAGFVREHMCTYFERLSIMLCKERKKSLRQIIPCVSHLHKVNK